MKYLYWNNKFEVDIPELDEQHQSLIELINQLSSAVSRKDTSSIINQASEKLIRYTALHFRDEEEIIMQCSTMPESEKAYHYEQHAMFLQHIHSLVEGSDFSNLEFTADLLDYLSTWLISHILSTDMRLASYVKRDNGTLVEIEDEESITVSHVERVLLGALNESESRFRMFSDHTSTMIWISNESSSRVFFNQAWQDFIRDQKALAGDNWHQYFHPDDIQPYLKFISEIHQNQHSGEFEYRLRTPDGYYRSFYERVMPRFEMDHSFIGMTGSAIDITQLKEAEAILSKTNLELEEQIIQRTREIQELTQTDPLTEVYNRLFVQASMEIELKRSKRHGRPLSLLVLDIDEFKRVNEQLGYNAGDRLLKQLALSIQLRLRESDVFGRYSGDEFIAILPETTLTEAALLAELIQMDIGQKRFEGLMTPMTISVGVAELNRTEAKGEWLSRCQKALRLAIVQGGDQVQKSKNINF